MTVLEIDFDFIFVTVWTVKLDFTALDCVYFPDNLSCVKLLMSSRSFIIRELNSNPVRFYFSEGSPYMMSREVKFCDLSPLGSSRSSMHRESRCFAVCVCV